MGPYTYLIINHATNPLNWNKQVPVNGVAWFSVGSWISIVRDSEWGSWFQSEDLDFRATIYREFTFSTDTAIGDDGYSRMLFKRTWILDRPATIFRNIHEKTSLFLAHLSAGFSYDVFWVHSRTDQSLVQGRRQERIITEATNRSRNVRG